MDRALEGDVLYKMHLLKPTKFTNSQIHSHAETTRIKFGVLEPGAKIVNGVQRLNVEGH